MNMNSTSRLDDKINSILVATALALALGFGVDMYEGAALGTDGGVAVELAKADGGVQVAQAAVNPVR